MDIKNIIKRENKLKKLAKKHWIISIIIGLSIVGTALAGAGVIQNNHSDIDQALAETKKQIRTKRIYRQAVKLFTRSETEREYIREILIPKISISQTMYSTDEEILFSSVQHRFAQNYVLNQIEKNKHISKDMHDIAIKVYTALKNKEENPKETKRLLDQLVTEYIL